MNGARSQRLHAVQQPESPSIRAVACPCGVERPKPLRVVVQGKWTFLPRGGRGASPYCFAGLWANHIQTSSSTAGRRIARAPVEAVNLALITFLQLLKPVGLLRWRSKALRGVPSYESRRTSNAKIKPETQRKLHCIIYSKWSLTHLEVSRQLRASISIQPDEE